MKIPFYKIKSAIKRTMREKIYQRKQLPLTDLRKHMNKSFPISLFERARHDNGTDNNILIVLGKRNSKALQDSTMI